MGNSFKEKERRTKFYKTLGIKFKTTIFRTSLVNFKNEERQIILD